ncbi:unnamed protein product [Spirodela intermedia]|uniref:Uncharacterized protein n=2 Tax=Spirodela intermedia TaxID=51605 RepID=A0A7I8IAW4_SPIIN|nr:unnamed protein product [Spirodela intermedia]CAA6654835.1 unnamed protein product [Spirodela intermedia]CAA7389530.1 unnamed protein product [Spirodela intermedia]
MKKAQEEVRRIVGGKPMVEESDLPNLVYLKIVVKETLRRHPPGPLSLPHESMKDVKSVRLRYPRQDHGDHQYMGYYEGPHVLEGPRGVLAGAL